MTAEQICVDCDHEKSEHDMVGSGACGVGWTNDGHSSEPGDTPCQCPHFEEPVSEEGSRTR